MYRIKYKSHKTTEELTALIIFAWRKNANEELNWLLRFYAVANLTRRLADTTIFDLQIGELIFHTDVLDRSIINQTHATERGLELPCAKPPDRYHFALVPDETTPDRAPSCLISRCYLIVGSDLTKSLNSNNYYMRRRAFGSENPNSSTLAFAGLTSMLSSFIRLSKVLYTPIERIEPPTPKRLFELTCLSF